MCLIVWCLVNSRRGRGHARGHYDSVCMYVYNHISNIVNTNARGAVAVAVVELICVLGV
jgi:hypothetical protein